MEWQSWQDWLRTVPRQGQLLGELQGETTYLFLVKCQDAYFLSASPERQLTVTARSNNAAHFFLYHAVNHVTRLRHGKYQCAVVQGAVSPGFPTNEWPHHRWVSKAELSAMFDGAIGAGAVSEDLLLLLGIDNIFSD